MGQQKPQDIKATSPVPIGKKLTLSRTSVEALFKLKAGQATTISIIDDGAVRHDLAGKLISHMHPGMESGLISARLNDGAQSYKMLVSRSVKDKALSYWATLVPAQGNYAYRLEAQSEKEFILVLDKKENVVTE